MSNYIGASNTPPPGLTIQQNQAKSVLNINGCVRIEYTKPIPSSWEQFWQKFLLGWEWTDLTKVAAPNPVTLAPTQPQSTQSNETNDQYIMRIFCDYIDLNSMSKFLVSSSEILLIAPRIRQKLKQIYPHYADQIRLWEVLHGVK